MRLSALSMQGNAHRANREHELGRVLNGTVKTPVSALHGKEEMPKPPVEPEAPDLRTDNASDVTVLKKEATAESGGDVVKSHIEDSTESRGEAGSRFQGRAVEDTSLAESSYDHGSDSRSRYGARGEDGVASANPAVRGMTQEESTSAHRMTSRVYNDRGSRRNNDGGDVGKMEEVDMLDSEEGGGGLRITMAKKRPTRIGMGHRTEDMVHDKGDVINERRDVAESGRRFQSGDGRFVDGNKRMSVGENYHENLGKQGFAGEVVKKRTEPIPSEYKYTRRWSDETTHGVQQLGGVYRRSDTDGIGYPAAMQGSLQREGREYRAATSNSDVSERSRLRN